ncbi:MAG: hypothetical protein IKC46_13900 [Lachnospiraceae bacterium]|nr:hypothetical protein [Lachnospiraceae bacterium]
MALTLIDKLFLDRVTNYANEVMPDIDPQKTPISTQLEKLMPVLKEIAAEEKKTVEEIFIRYMDLASEAAIETNKKIKQKLDENNEFNIQIS